MTTMDRRILPGFATFVFFSGLAPDAWRNSISWYGYGLVVAIATAASIVVLVRYRRNLRGRDLPLPLLAFHLLATASIAWSFYPLETAAAALTQAITSVAALAVALVLTTDELVRALARALRIILALSLLFELVVSLVIRAPVFPVWVTAEDRVDPPKLLYWSRNLLLEGDRIQGIVGSSSLLAMVALLAVIVFGVQLRAGTVRRWPGLLWLAIAFVTIGLTRSATIYIGLLGVIVVVGMVFALRAAPTPRARRAVYAGLAGGGVLLVVAGFLLRGPILAAFGKSDDLTGRLGIWDAVVGLAQQRPIAGWGWVSFWPPWREPFRDLVTAAGVQQLHAHNAWLDVWLQLGILGLLVFGALVLTTGVRSWLLATTGSGGTRVGPPGGFEAMSLLPLLLLTALLVQSLAESRILLEGGWLLLVILAVTTKRSTTPAAGCRNLGAR